ncbi:MAG: response regulator [Acidobacteriota bacterium]|nr:response regulator [Acidobacteriota bacterium]
MEISGTILLVDDDAVQAVTRQTVLRRAGYLAVATLDPQRALEQLRENEFAEPLLLVITDHRMPLMQGPEFVRALRQHQPSLPVLVITGLEDVEPEYAGLDVMILQKPLPPEQLLASVRALAAPRMVESLSR